MRLSAVQNDFRDWLQIADEDAALRLDLTDIRGLAVYQNNYRAQLMACLEESYPQVLAWVGDDAFHAAAAQHIDSYPPHSWTLDDYPIGFPASLRAQFPDDAELADLAELELRLAECFIAADASLLDLSSLADIDWDSATLRLAPSASMLTLQTNAAQIWSALTAGKAPPAAQHLSEPARLLVWRQDYVSCFRVIDPDEGDLLAKLIPGLGFAEMCADLVIRLGEAEGVAKAGALLAGWTQDQLLCRPIG